MPVRQRRSARGRPRRRAGRPQPAPGRRGAVRLSLAALTGVLLADEVGLGKTIEAGLGAVAEVGGAQAAHPRHHAGQPAQAVASGADREVLPALPDPRSAGPTTTPIKAGPLPAVRARRRRSSSAPTSSRETRRPTSRNTPWDLVVIDEAHRLRNVYKPSNVIANTLKHGAGRQRPSCC